MNLPAHFITSIRHTKGFDQPAFEQVHASGQQITSIRLNPLKPVRDNPAFLRLCSPIPWTEHGYYLAERPSFTFDSLFHAGCYYVQEASSMLLEQAMRQHTDLSQPLKVLDLSAAPGGKSTHLQSLISRDSLLVSNEVIRSRAQILKDNIIKWGGANTAVTNNDPRDFARLPGYFDVVVVDAPCSGSGLFRREPEAMEEWSTQNVQLCAQRQQRILADVLPSLKKDGLLIYSTCSYSEEEDEAIGRWLVNECGLRSLSLSLPADWGIIQSEGGYRCWPDQVKGEGFFLACFQKTTGETGFNGRPNRKPVLAPSVAIPVLKKWIRTEGMKLLMHETSVYAWPEHLFDDFSLLLDKLRVLYTGVLVGELIRDKLVPDHALAMSTCLSDQVKHIELLPDAAILYLQKKELNIENAEKGWQLVTYGGYPLGWVNVLPNRINNYYPKELRILKDK